jgi:hypothetical protein
MEADMRKTLVSMGAVLVLGACSSGNRGSADGSGNELGVTDPNVVILSVPFSSQYIGSRGACDCGPTSIAMILRYYQGASEPPDASLINEVRATTGNQDICNTQTGEFPADFDAINLRTALSAYSMSYTPIPGSLSKAGAMNEIRKAIVKGYPVIAFVNGSGLERGNVYKHWFVVTGFAFDSAYDPSDPNAGVEMIQAFYVNDSDDQDPSAFSAEKKANFPNWIRGGKTLRMSRQAFQSSLDTSNQSYGYVVYRPNTMFHDLSQDIPMVDGTAAFSFAYDGGENRFQIELASSFRNVFTTSNLRVTGGGSASPISVADLRYACGSKIYWHVVAGNGTTSPAIEATLDCNACEATFSSAGASFAVASSVAVAAGICPPPPPPPPPPPGCGSTCTEIILGHRSDIVNLFASNGWDTTSCAGREKLLNHWCNGGVSPEAMDGCAAEKAEHSICASSPTQFCGSACTQAILATRFDILRVFWYGGWSTACENHEAIVNHWCNGGVSPEAVQGCIAEKKLHAECQ